MKNIKMFIPYSTDYLVINSNNMNRNYIYIYNSNNFLFLSLNNKEIFINKETNILELNSLEFNNYNNLSILELNNFLYSWENFFFNKIKFSGKGFKFKKKISNLFLFFNRAHKCFFIGTNIILIRLSKNKIILLKNNKSHLFYDSKIIVNVRSNNIFTKRGLRFSRQFILKKKGKGGKTS